MFVAAGDVHGAKAVPGMSLEGPTLSFTLVDANQSEIGVRNSSAPVVMSLPAAPQGAKVSVGEKDAKARFANLQEGGVDPTEQLQCRYFDEELEEWSTDGCRTFEQPNSSDVGCACDHLSDFIAVKVPAPVGGEIELRSWTSPRR
jgi:hypothetical protein